MLTTLLVYVACDIRALVRAESSCKTLHAIAVGSDESPSPWRMLSEVIPLDEMKESKLTTEGVVVEPLGLRRNVVRELCQTRKCLFCGEHCTIISNTREQCWKHTGVFLSLGPWDRKWSCCGATHEDIPGCEQGGTPSTPSTGARWKCFERASAFRLEYSATASASKSTRTALHVRWQRKMAGRSRAEQTASADGAAQSLRRPLKTGGKRREESGEKSSTAPWLAWICFP